ncbi:2-dehydro-3-deoxygalactonokinase [Stenotrophomonas sp. HITSZ_GD]|uniref:2-dehydro-3-deoxygalactonokinase n=1 Tax=Stenotrophomonas sp. HITSZ_GD TaxID=3037248 RepID=UPI00240D4010|nr:2-dehydro-3-deoxygalactonokinase [Stenotrophomonas sp. HITSZ_GD]MDG2526891.1 2-dehydro-3-deoxygalactonokinase [Stenotrophomonas sp. HITSZ_GD]
MIAVDWGTSSLRAYRLAEDGSILEQRRDPRGILACDGSFADVLAELVGEWPGEIVLCGMIGSRNGWIELPYLPCPADAGALAAAMHAHTDARLPGRTLWFVPGVACHAGAGVPDVMRGEETQLVGLAAALGGGRHLVCLPGTHSKWAWLEDGRIVEFATVMTGELYAVLRQHSLLGRLMTDDGHAFDEAAFAQGVARSGEDGGLSHHLFGTRTLALFERLPGDALASYLSGLLIGHEIRHRTPAPRDVHLVGSAGLGARYAHALALLDIGAHAHGEDLAARGLHAMASARGIAPA